MHRNTHNDTLADVNVFASFLRTSFSATSVFNFAGFLTFVVDCDLLTVGSVEVGRCSFVTTFNVGFALSALRDLTRVLDSLLTLTAVDSARLESLVVDADWLLLVIVLASLSPDTGTLDALDVNDDRLRPVLVWAENDRLSALSDGVTGRRGIKGLLTGTTPRSDRGRDPDPALGSGRGRESAVESLCSRSGRYRSRRRNSTGGDAEPATDK